MLDILHDRLDVRVLDADGEIIELKDDEEDYAPVYHEESYASDDAEIENRGYYIEDVPVDDDDVSPSSPSNAFERFAAMNDSVNEEDE